MLESSYPSEYRTDYYYSRALAYRARGDVSRVKSDGLHAAVDRSMSLLTMLNRARNRSYYDGADDAALGDKQKIAVEACMVDPEC
jgi:hypothetical protein